MPSEQRRSPRRRLLADSLDGGPELSGQVAPDRRLQFGVPVVAELDGEAHDRGRTRTRRRGEVGDRAERDDLWAGEHRLGDPPFGRREAFGPFAEPLLDLHGPPR